MATATSTVTVDINLSTAPIAKLEQELSKVQEDLKNIDRGTEAGAKKFDLMSQKAAKLSNALNKANTAAEGFTDEKKFMAADGAIQAMAGSLTATVGALGLIGVESEAFGELEKKAASAIAVGMGVNDVRKGFKQLKDSTILATAATKAYNIAVSAGNKIMKLFNITMALNPIGVFIAALTAVGALIYAFRDNIKNLIDAALGPLGSAVDFIADKFTKLGQALGVLATDEEKAIQKTIDGLERQLAVRSARGEDTLELEKKILKEKRKLLEKGTDEYEENLTAQLVINARIQKQKDDQQAEQDAKDKAARDKRIADKKAQDEKDKADADAKAKEDADREKARVASIEGILSDFVKRQQDIDADTRVKKVELEEQRKIEDLIALKATQEQIDEIRAFYKERRKEAEALDKEETDTKNEENKQKMFDDLNKSIELEYQAAQEKIAAKGMVVDAVAMFAGQETAIGKAAFIAQQYLRLEDLKASASATLKKIALDATEGTVDVSKGFLSTLKAGFPKNIPFLIAYAAQAAGLVGAMASAVGKAKGVSSSIGASGANIPTLTSPGAPGGGAGNLGQNIGPTQVQQGPVPETNTVQPTVRAYVVSGDVNSAQEADARLSKRRTLG